MRKNHHSSCAIEIKATSGTTIPASALLPHQKQALLSAKGVGLAFKIPDFGRRNPFDAFFLKGAEAYVIACFTSYGLCYMVPIEEWEGVKLSKPPKVKVIHTSK